MKAEIQITGVPTPLVARATLPLIVKLVPGKMTIVRLRPVPVKTKHPSLSIWNSKAIMWGQG